MKLNLLIVVFTMAITGANAGHNQSVLTLRMQDQALFLVTLDNVCYEVPQRVMTFEDLSPGSHHLYATKVRLNRWGRIIYKEIVFDGMIHIPGGSDLEAVITRFGEFRIKRIHTITPVVFQQPFYDPYNTPVQCGPEAMHEHDFRMLIHAIENASL